MRARILIRKLSSKPLPYDYQYGLASMLYGKLKFADGDLARFMHAYQGYRHYPPTPVPRSRKMARIDEAHFHTRKRNWSIEECSPREL
ncbi:MAG: hypothetical protein ACE5QW_07105 [Thermoplasmata archaeon]